MEKSILLSLLCISTFFVICYSAPTKQQAAIIEELISEADSYATEEEASETGEEVESSSSSSPESDIEANLLNLLLAEMARQQDHHNRKQAKMANAVKEKLSVSNQQILKSLNIRDLPNYGGTAVGGGAGHEVDMQGLSILAGLAPLIPSLVSVFTGLARGGRNSRNRCE